MIWYAQIAFKIVSRRVGEKKKKKEEKEKKKKLQILITLLQALVDIQHQTFQVQLEIFEENSGMFFTCFYDNN